MLLPIYNKNSIHIQESDFNLIINSIDLDKLCYNIFECYTKDLTTNVINQYLSSDKFKNGADYSDTVNHFQVLNNLIYEILKLAQECGFPSKLNCSGAQFDLKLSKFIYEFFEKNDICCRPSEFNIIELQLFFTQRIIPLITYWRWFQNGKINESRIKYGMRNYFYTLFMTAWLFDKGKDIVNRWEYFEVLSADILVSIIERPGIGYRKGFAHAIANEILLRKNKSKKLNIDKLIRGVMKRATFTFSVSIMPDEKEYYVNIVSYLFNWSEKNYLIDDDKNIENDLEFSFSNQDNNSNNEISNTNLIIELKNQDEILGSDVPEFWYKLSSWTKEHNYFKGRDRQFIYQLGDLLKRGVILTSKQQSYKDSILRQVKELGYFNIIVENKINNTINTVFDPKFYIKKLTANELGYRNGVLTTGQMFYISKQASVFFPSLSNIKNNDTVNLSFNVSYNPNPISIKLVYHNDKFNKEKGTRDEYRIYLNKEIAPHDLFFKPNDIIVFERMGESDYNMKKINIDDEDYVKYDELIFNCPTKGQHALLNNI
jgi:hypothetical protein